MEIELFLAQGALRLALFSPMKRGERYAQSGEGTNRNNRIPLSPTCL